MTIVRQPNLYNSLWDHANQILKREPYTSEQFTPAVNIKETKDNYELYMAVPGLHKEDITVQLDSGVLSISSDKEMEMTNTEHEKYTHVEFKPTPFKRVFSLPENTIEEGEIQANYESGVLTVIIPKKEEAKPVVRQIAIN